MTIIKAIILGVIQGITEFLPVSSSGHLEIAKYFMTTNYIGDDSLLMTVVLHFATALSTVIVFRKKIYEIIKGVFQPSMNIEKNYVFYIVLSMIPAALVGVFLEDWIDDFFSGNILFVGWMLLVTAVLLLLADRAKHTTKEVGWLSAIIIGIAQAIAILPGISRSGATISTSVLLRIDRESSAHFSFLMVIPLIFGKIAKDVISGEFTTSHMSFLELGLGFLAALLTGIFACKLMIRLVKSAKLWYFALYCFLIGTIVIVISIL